MADATPGSRTICTPLRELRREDARGFKNFLLIDYELFKEILRRIEGRIRKQDNDYRKSLSPGLRLAITFRHLASGDSYRTLMYGFGVSHNSIVSIIPEVCEAIVAEFGTEFMSTPTTEDEWKAVATQFSEKWQFHHCLGALDGKHIALHCPSGRGSLFYNYKGFHSIILMALVDANYKFLWVEVGAHGSAGDGHVFNNSELKEAIDCDALNIPAPDPCRTTTKQCRTL